MTEREEYQALLRGDLTSEEWVRCLSARLAVERARARRAGRRAVAKHGDALRRLSE